MTLEQNLRTNAIVKDSPCGSDFRLVINQCDKGQIGFYIHPINRDGDTLDFMVVGDTLIPRTRSVHDYPKSIPRRACLELLTTEERIIHDAIQAIERMPAADIKLTQAQVLLAQAKNLISDFIDDVPPTTVDEINWPEKIESCTTTDELDAIHADVPPEYETFWQNKYQELANGHGGIPKPPNK